jgi:hypothetical protein
MIKVPISSPIDPMAHYGKGERISIVSYDFLMAIRQYIIRQSADHLATIKPQTLHLNGAAERVLGAPLIRILSQINNVTHHARVATGNTTNVQGPHTNNVISPGISVAYYSEAAMRIATIVQRLNSLKSSAPMTALSQLTSSSALPDINIPLGQAIGSSWYTLVYEMLSHQAYLQSNTSLTQTATSFSSFLTNDILSLVDGRGPSVVSGEALNQALAFRSIITNALKMITGDDPYGIAAAAANGNGATMLTGTLSPHQATNTTSAQHPWADDALILYLAAAGYLRATETTAAYDSLFPTTPPTTNQTAPMVRMITSAKITGLHHYKMCFAPSIYATHILSLAYADAFKFAGMGIPEPPPSIAGDAKKFGDAAAYITQQTADFNLQAVTDLAQETWDLAKKILGCDVLILNGAVPGSNHIYESFRDAISRMVSARVFVAPVDMVNPLADTRSSYYGSTQFRELAVLPNLYTQIIGLRQSMSALGRTISGASSSLNAFKEFLGVAGERGSLDPYYTFYRHGQVTNPRELEYSDPTKAYMLDTTTPRFTYAPGQATPLTHRRLDISWSFSDEVLRLIRISALKARMASATAENPFHPYLTIMHEEFRDLDGSEGWSMSPVPLNYLRNSISGIGALDRDTLMQLLNSYSARPKYGETSYIEALRLELEGSTVSRRASIASSFSGMATVWIAPVNASLRGWLQTHAAQFDPSGQAVPPTGLITTLSWNVVAPTIPVIYGIPLQHFIHFNGSPSTVLATPVTAESPSPMQWIGSFTDRVGNLMVAALIFHRQVPRPSHTEKLIFSRGDASSEYTSVDVIMPQFLLHDFPATNDGLPASNNWWYRSLWHFTNGLSSLQPPLTAGATAPANTLQFDPQRTTEFFSNYYLLQRNIILGTEFTTRLRTYYADHVMEPLRGWTRFFMPYAGYNTKFNRAIAYNDDAELQNNLDPDLIGLPADAIPNFVLPFVTMQKVSHPNSAFMVIAISSNVEVGMFEDADVYQAETFNDVVPLSERPSEMTKIAFSVAPVGGPISLLPTDGAPVSPGNDVLEQAMAEGGSSTPQPKLTSVTETLEMPTLAASTDADGKTTYAQVNVPTNMNVPGTATVTPADAEVQPIAVPPITQPNPTARHPRQR